VIDSNDTDREVIDLDDTDSDSEPVRAKRRRLSKQTETSSPQKVYNLRAREPAARSKVKKILGLGSVHDDTDGEDYPVIVNYLGDEPGEVDKAGKRAPVRQVTGNADNEPDSSDNR
jgi:hypothetical protein